MTYSRQIYPLPLKQVPLLEEARNIGQLVIGFSASRLLQPIEDHNFSDCNVTGHLCQLCGKFSGRNQPRYILLACETGFSIVKMSEIFQSIEGSLAKFDLQLVGGANRA